MTNNVRTLGKAGSDLLTEITRQGKRIFTYEDAVKIYSSSNRRLRELSSTLARMHKAGGLRFLTDWQSDSNSTRRNPTKTDTKGFSLLPNQQGM